MPARWKVLTLSTRGVFTTAGSAWVLNVAGAANAAGGACEFTRVFTLEGGADTAGGACKFTAASEACDFSTGGTAVDVDIATAGDAGTAQPSTLIAHGVVTAGAAGTWVVSA